MRSPATKKVDPVDKSAWPTGPWNAEPDRVQWTTRVGLPGLIRRNVHGALCGYVGVGPAHPWHGRSYFEVNDFDVHCGLSYGDASDDESGITLTRGPGEIDRLWWFGFHTEHLFDLVPARAVEDAAFHARFAQSPRQTYRDLAYVRDQVERLAAHVASAAIEKAP